MTSMLWTETLSLRDKTASGADFLTESPWEASQIIC